jgi:IclR family transcriptional regulator, KDG regulon repressor
VPRIEGAQVDGVQAVVLTLRILEYLAEHDEDVGVTVLADALGTTKSRVFRHLQTLLQQGYVARSNDSERYRTGTNLVALGLSVGDRLDISVAAEPVLRNLREALGHSAVVSRFEEDGMRVLRTLRGTSQVEIGVRPGSLLSFHGTAQGKLALAYGPDALRERVLMSRLQLLTPNTIVSPAALKEELDRIKGRGWAVAPNEALLGLNTLAAPVFDGAGDFVGAVAMNDSIQFIEAQPADEQIRLVIEGASRISRELGFRGS